MRPGVPGPVLGWVAGSLSASTTINDTTTYTTGGVTFAAPPISNGAVYLVTAFGSFTAVSSATARNAEIACFWGATQLTAITVAVTASTAQTTNFRAEFILVGTSSTAIWTSGISDNAIALRGPSHSLILPVDIWGWECPSGRKHHGIVPKTQPSSTSRTFLESSEIV
jgi:hypothetical protein